MPTNKVQFANNCPVEVALKYASGKLVNGSYGDQYYYSLSHSSDGAPGMYLDPEAASKIDRLKVRPNEPFWICKRKGAGRNAAVIWDVWKGEQTGPVEQQHQNGSSIEREMARSMDRLHAQPGFGYGSVHGELSIPRLATLEEMDNATGAGRVPEKVAPAPALSTSEDQPRTVPAALETGAQAGTPQSTRRPPRTQLADALCTAAAAWKDMQEFAREQGIALPPATFEDLRCMANTLVINAANRGNGRAA
jgi:hypothetical protein